MRILLISPRWEGFGNRKKVKVRERRARPLTLGILAGLCDGHDVTIVDEHTRAVPFHEGWDLVGITVTTYRAPRAYEIADRFRALGVPVVMGGVHATLCPDDCLEHCTTVVRGEAEPVWDQVLEDAGKKQLAPRYEGGMLQAMERIPSPRRDLYGPPRQNPTYFQASRGCGWTCTFCYLQNVGWGSFRVRPIDHVIREMKALDEWVIALVDDNLFIKRQYAIDLFREMKKQNVNKFWWAQAPSTICLDDELLEAAYESGCFALSIGFQTVNNGSLKEAKVNQNKTRKYQAQVANVRRHKILCDTTWIFGFDEDTTDTFKDTVEAIRTMGVDAYSLYFLTAYPGTPEYDKLDAEGRITDHNLSKYDWDHATVQPAQMSIEELERGVAWMYNELDGSALAWMKRQLTSNTWVLDRSKRLALYLLQNTFYQRYQNAY